jgi:hypothetical protein
MRGFIQSGKVKAVLVWELTNMAKNGTKKATM